MAAPTSGPCAAWATVDDLALCHTSTASAGQKTAALNAASDLLWRWSGYRYGGVCSETVRPCAQNNGLGDGYDYRDTYDFGFGYGGWWNWEPAWGFCSCSASPHRDCGCSYLSEIRLGRVPVVSITTVKVDGVVLVNGTDYRVDDFEYLVRLGGNSWPCCQSLGLDDTHADTFSVAFTWGRAPSAAGVQAAVDLASKIIDDCLAGNCEVPSTASSITRQGTQITLISPERYGRDQFGNVKIGIRSVDYFLSSVPTGRPGLISSPESRAQVRRANT